MRLLLGVLLTGVTLIGYKIITSNKEITLLKILLFINSLVINDLSLRYVGHGSFLFVGSTRVRSQHSQHFGYFYSKNS